MSKEVESWVLSHYGLESFCPGLERISEALKGLKEILSESKIVIIAGTNGKGETTHRLSEYLNDSTYCAWTSPHIIDICERFTSEEGKISSTELKQLVFSTHEIVSAHQYKLSFYEFLFFVFCRWAALRKPNYLLLEVGLGGRLDAVNALDADLVLLTSISRDHQEFLGHRYDQILKEKLGVLRPKSKLLSYLDLNYLRERASSTCEKVGCLHTDLNLLKQLPSFAFSERNQFLAYAALCELKQKALNANEWLPSARELPSRGELLSLEHEWCFYGSHNVDGMRKLIQFLRAKNYNFTQRPYDFVLTSFSKRSETDLRVMLRMLQGSKLGHVMVASFPHPKAYPHDELKEIAFQEGLNFVDNVSEIVEVRPRQKILVVGSYYFMGHIKSLLRL